jgi:hypothetical protein
MPPITLVVTSCGRWPLLRATLESLFGFARGQFAHAVIIDDSGVEEDLSWIRSVVDCGCEIIQNATNIGQLASIDRAYSRVQTEWLFHCEDDWLFTASGFLDASWEIMRSRPDIVTVWLRAWSDTNGHPLAAVRPGETFPRLMLGYRGKWHGFTFNPGLRRLADYHRLAPFTGLGCREFDPPKRRKPHQYQLGEADISIYYRDLGYSAAISPRPEGYVCHIGDDQHLTSWRDVRSHNGQKT